VYEKSVILIEFGLPVTIGCKASHVASYVFTRLRFGPRLARRS
jgi:hypothetical protein